MNVLLFAAKSYLNNSVENDCNFYCHKFWNVILNVFNPFYWYFWYFPPEIHVGKKLKNNRECLDSTSQEVFTVNFENLIFFQIHPSYTKYTGIYSILCIPDFVYSLEHQHSHVKLLSKHHLAWMRESILYLKIYFQGFWNMMSVHQDHWHRTQSF